MFWVVVLTKCPFSFSRSRRRRFQGEASNTVRSSLEMLEVLEMLEILEMFEMFLQQK